MQPSFAKFDRLLPVINESLAGDDRSIVELAFKSVRPVPRKYGFHHIHPLTGKEPSGRPRYMSGRPLGTIQEAQAGFCSSGYLMILSTSDSRLDGTARVAETPTGVEAIMFRSARGTA